MEIEMQEQAGSNSQKGQLKDLTIRMAKIEQTLTDLQVAIARLETSQSQSYKTLTVIGSVALTAVAGILAKLLMT